MAIAGRQVLLVDDHAVVRSGLATVLVALGATVVAEAGSTPEALELSERIVPDLVVTDLSMPGPNGLQLTRSLRARYPTLHILMLSSFAESLFAEQAIAAGALGYLMKDEPVATFRTAVEAVAAGNLYLSEPMWESLLVTPRAASLDDAQQGVLDALATDNPPVALIAERVERSEREVVMLLASLVGELRLPNEVALRVFAARAARSNLG